MLKRKWKKRFLDCFCYVHIFVLKHILHMWFFEGASLELLCSFTTHQLCKIFIIWVIICSRYLFCEREWKCNVSAWHVLRGKQRFLVCPRLLKCPAALCGAICGPRTATSPQSEERLYFTSSLLSYSTAADHMNPTTTPLTQQRCQSSPGGWKLSNHQMKR